MNITEEKICRICSGRLVKVLDLGMIYPSSFLRDNENVTVDGKAPLVLAECESCGLIQLKHTIDLDLMYRQYWYASSLNKSMVSSLQDIVIDIQTKVTLQPYDVVMDIGCNDGTMLGMYPDFVTTVGYDPSKNLEKKFPINYFINDYFTADAYQYPLRAKVVTAIAMFYDLPDPNKFVEDVKQVLDKDGIFVVQFTDLMSMMKAVAFDNICHEHLEYYKLKDIVRLFRSHGLDVIDVSYNNVNGGSIRITACHDGRYTPKSDVFKYLSEERTFFHFNKIQNFVNDVIYIKTEVKEFLKWTTTQNYKVFLLGASTKGNTLLQVCNITDDEIPFAAEVNKEKFGLRTAGSNIKIISEDEALEQKPDMFFVPVWHFKEFLLNNNRIKMYLLEGGKLVFPLPYFHVVYIDHKGDLQEERIVL